MRFTVDALKALLFILNEEDKMNFYTKGNKDNLIIALCGAFHDYVNMQVDIDLQEYVTKRNNVGPRTKRAKKLIDAFQQNIKNTLNCSDFTCNVKDSIMTFIYDEIGYESFIRDILVYKYEERTDIFWMRFTVDSLEALFNILNEEDKLNFYTTGNLIVKLCESYHDYDVIIYAIENIPNALREQILQRSAKTLLGHCFSFDDEMDSPWKYLEYVCSQVRSINYKYIYVDEDYTCFINSFISLLRNNSGANYLWDSEKHKLYFINNCCFKRII